jgi:hypothetical protein
VPVALACVLLVAIAWLSRYLPRRGAGSAASLPADGVPVHFTRLAKSDDPDYVPEFEADADGHVDFLFENTSDVRLKMGLLRHSCSCARLDVCLLTPDEVKAVHSRATPEEALPGLAQRWHWLKDMAQSKAAADPLIVPAAGKGLARLSWKGRPGQGTRVRLVAELWLGGVDGNLPNLKPVAVDATILLVPAVRVFPHEQPLPTSPPKGAVRDFWFWSATRDRVEVAPAGGPSFLTCTAQPLSRSECAELARRLRKADMHAAVRSACRLRVTLAAGHEPEGTSPSFMLPVRVTADGQAVIVANPVLTRTAVKPSAAPQP